MSKKAAVTLTGQVLELCPGWLQVLHTHVDLGIIGNLPSSAAFLAMSFLCENKQQLKNYTI